MNSTHKLSLGLKKAKNYTEKKIEISIPMSDGSSLSNEI
jgi:hypothetical protein